MKRFEFLRRSTSKTLAINSGFLLVTLMFMTYTLVIIDRPEPLEFGQNLVSASMHGHERIYQLSGIDGLQKSLESQQADNGVAFYSILADSDFQYVAGDIPTWPSELTNVRGHNVATVSKLTSGDLDIPLMLSYQILPLENGYFLLQGTDARAAIDFVKTMGNVKIFLFATIILSCVGGFFSSSYMLRRMKGMNETINDIISTGNLSARLPVLGSEKDFDNLASNLNSMLDRIQTLMDEVRHVADNIAHDLRTPLTRLQNRLDTLARTDMQDDVSQQLVVSLQEDVDNLLTVFNSLLRIANIESGKRHADFQEIQLGNLVRDLVEYYEPLASNKNQAMVSTVQDIKVFGDADLLFQAFANILENAIKYTPVEGEIDISAEVLDDKIQLTIADNGEGISDEDKSKVLLRFFRVEKSRSSQGNGLGLSLVSAIVDLHKGAMELIDNKPGLGVRILLPTVHY